MSDEMLYRLFGGLALLLSCWSSPSASFQEISVRLVTTKTVSRHQQANDAAACRGRVPVARAYARLRRAVRRPAAQVTMVDVGRQR